MLFNVVYPMNSLLRSLPFSNFVLHRRFSVPRALVVISLVFSFTTSAFAQGDNDIASGEDDPVKLFERGQDAHARGDLTEALEFYDEAIKLRPDFPEAEYQRGTIFVATQRFAEAEKALRRATELRPEWVLPFAALGDLLVLQKKDTEAEQVLSQALKLDPTNPTALVAATELRLRTKAPREQLMQLLAGLRTASTLTNSTPNLWSARASVERATGDSKSAIASFDHALAMDAKNVNALVGRAEALFESGEYAQAIAGAKDAHRIAPTSISAGTALVAMQLHMGNCDDAARTLDELDSATKQPSATASLRQTFAIQCATGENVRQTLEQALAKEPRNATVLSRLCEIYRKDDPQRSVDYCRRALETEPGNANYATSYAAALVQARRFQEAVTLLQRIIANAPDNYAAHANLATALYELKLFPEAISEYNWILKAKPDLYVTNFFIGTAHDNLGEYPQALAAYEAFLRSADPQKFQLEIEKVNLRLPNLRDQIKLGQGKKKKT
jgi:tetratricopeptide (TPR) repeat protein